MQVLRPRTKLLSSGQGRRHVRRGIYALRRLRWKLALSYTLVTVLALLVAELILVAALMAFLISPVVPSLAARYVGNEVAPRLEPGLSQNPPDVAGVRGGGGAPPRGRD